MSTIFESIIAGRIPGKFVWADEAVVAFATIEPVAPGHTLVVPRHPVSKWTDLSADLLRHLFSVAQVIGRAAETAFHVPRAALLIAGFEVPHTHLHVIPARSEADCSLASANAASADELAADMERLRDELMRSGYGHQVPERIDSL